MKETGKSLRHVKVRETNISKTKMDVMKKTDFYYNDIIRRNRDVIRQLEKFFDLREIANEKMHKRGRLNNTWMRALTSDYKHCFTKKNPEEKVPITILVDVSGSMCFYRLKVAKEACVVFCEALDKVVDLRLVLFTGIYDAVNVVVKDFGERLDPRKVDMIGGVHGQGENLDGASILHEAKINKGGVIIAFSDGRPTGDRYGMAHAVEDVREANKLAQVYAFVIDHEPGSKWMSDLYGHGNYVVVQADNPKDFKAKFLKFGQLIVKKFMG